jgi:hypothetical protein
MPTNTKAHCTTLLPVLCPYPLLLQVFLSPVQCDATIKERLALLGIRYGPHGTIGRLKLRFGQLCIVDRHTTFRNELEYLALSTTLQLVSSCKARWH